MTRRTDGPSAGRTRNAGGNRSARRQLTPGDHRIPLPGWKDRDLLVHVPHTYNPDKPTALVFVIHGGGGNSDRMRQFVSPDGDPRAPMSLDSVAARKNVVVVYPNGTPTGKANGRCWASGQPGSPAEKQGVDDVRYFRDATEALSGVLNLDRKRVYALGHSNGAAMTHRLGAEASDLFAAIAPISGPVAFSPHEKGSPVPVVYFHGTRDRWCPFEGGDTYYGEALSAEETLEYWLNRNRCEARPSQWSPLPDTDSADGTRVVRRHYEGAADVDFYVVWGGGHTVPGGRNVQEMGPTSHDVSAAQIALDFFEKHPKR